MPHLAVCGIVGVLELEGRSKSVVECRAELERMLRMVAHRGPDEAGLFVDGQAALAAARLRISDPAHGQQPMTDPSGRWWIVYNGEIHNAPALRACLEARGHRFHTRCDTEVVLEAWAEWGEDAPRRFDGGFAFAVYDRVARQAHLVRDRAGKRPLFYRAEQGAVGFGSEIKALLGRDRTRLAWSPRNVASIFAALAPVGDATPFAGVKQVPPGGILRVTSSGLTLAAFASFPGADPRAGLGFDDAAAGAATRLRDAVRARMRADARVGVLLSGGLDSTIVAHLAKEACGGRLRSFSLTFDESAFDESGEQQRVARALDLDHTSLRVSDRDIVEHFRTALWHAETPQFRSALVPMYLLAKCVREHGVAVALTGEGSDEVFLGYDLFRETQLRSAWHSLTSGERRAQLRRLYQYLPHFSKAAVRTLEVLYGRWAGPPDDLLFSHAIRFASARFGLGLLRTDDDVLGELEEAAAAERLDRLPPLRRAQWLEVHTVLQGHLLSAQGDRMMFAHGVEPRCPFLAHDVVSFASTLPDPYLLSDAGEEKAVLKQAFRGRIPDRVLERPKQPYRAPDVSAFLRAGGGRGRLPDWVEDLLAPEALGRIDFVDTPAASRFLGKLRQTPPDRISPREDQAFLLLLSLAVLNAQFIDSRDVPRHAPLPPRTRVVDLSQGPK